MTSEEFSLLLTRRQHDTVKLALMQFVETLRQEAREHTYSGINNMRIASALEVLKLMGKDAC